MIGVLSGFPPDQKGRRGCAVADYYPLLARAVASLPENTAEARLDLYERARSALAAQLPGRNESDGGHERLSLEKAISSVESDIADFSSQNCGEAIGRSRR